MADRMAFPNTMKEFIESFSFKDSEEVYTNGAELIPVFRVEQGFEHYAKEIRAKAIDEFAHQFKENLNQEFPRNYESTRPYFSLENARLLVDEIAEQMKAGGIDG